MLFGFLAIILAAVKFLSQSWSPHRFINMMTSYNWCELHLKTQSSISYSENLSEPWLWINIECSGTKSELLSKLSYSGSHTCFLLFTGSSLTFALAHNYLIVNLWDLVPSCIHVMFKLRDQIFDSRLNIWFPLKRYKSHKSRFHLPFDLQAWKLIHLSLMPAEK